MKIEFYCNTLDDKGWWLSIGIALVRSGFAREWRYELALELLFWTLQITWK